MDISSVAGRLDNACNALESTKITCRKQGCDILNELLDDKYTFVYLNEGGQSRWNSVLGSIQTCLLKDIDKKNDPRRKSIPLTAPPIADVFFSFIRAAAKENAPLGFTKVFNFIVESLTDATKQCCHCLFLKILSHCFLLNASIRSTLKSSDWLRLYTVLKLLCEKTGKSNTEQIECLALVIKWGPVHSFPVDTLREAFTFVIKLCKQITLSSPKPEQNAVVQLVYDFCKHNAKDGHMACCKLGEEVLEKFIELYGGNSNDDKMKTNLVEFFLFQVAIHHPNGVRQGHAGAYAVSWTTWHKCLYSIYNILVNEIEGSLGRSVKNQSFFVVKNDVKMLLDVFVFLFVEVCRQLFDGDPVSNASSSAEEPPQKRMKVVSDVGFGSLIEKIKDTKAWTWINLTCPIIETYPDMIRAEDYLKLLKTLTTLQVESKDLNLTYHTYKALLVMEHVESTLNLPFCDDLEQLWQTITDSALRSTGILQIDEQIQTLLQHLISKKVITTHENVFQNYKAGGAMNLTKHNLKTLEVAFRNFDYLHFDNRLKIEIMQWILTNNSRCICDEYVAKMLVCLVLKQWPDCCVDQVSGLVEKPYRDIEDIYSTTSFEKLIVYSDKCIKQNQSVNVFCYDQNLYNTLVDLLVNLINTTSRDDVDLLTNVTVLIFNVISYLVDYQMIERNTIDDFHLFALFQTCTDQLFRNLNLQINKERSLEKICLRIQSLNLMFKTNISVLISRKLREQVPEDLIKDLFIDLQWEQEEIREFIHLKKCIMETLTNFACLPDSGDLSQMQQRALECLLESEYDYTNDTDYELVLTFLHCLKSCDARLLSENSFLSVFNLIQGICEARYRDCFVGVKILDLFCEIYPLVCDTALCRSTFVQLLFPFYSIKVDYGPVLSVRLLNCMGLLYELEPDCKHSQWVNEEIVLKIPEFLSSDYQEVRLSAVENIVKFFKLSSKTHLMSQFHRQEIMFSKIAEKSLEILQLEGDVSEERIIDETVTRTSTILHMFASIMIASYLWIDEALFKLLKVVCDKNIDLSQCSKVIEMVAEKLGFESDSKFLESHLVALVNRWKMYNIDSFPFSVFKCDDKIQFYSKYWNFLAPVIVENDRNSITAIASRLEKTPQELFTVACPNLFSYCMGREVTDLNSLSNNFIYQLLSKLSLRHIFEDKIDEIFLFLIDFVSDETDFKENFAESFIFRKHDEICLTVAQFQNCVQFLENTVCNESKLMLFMVQKHPEKIHHILLQLKLKINKSLAFEERLRHFHHFSIAVLLNMKSQDTMDPYFLKTLIHTLLHFIKNYKKQPELSEISCKFFKSVLQKIIPTFPTILKPFLLVIVSRLKNLAMEECSISDKCIEMLHFLIVDHGRLFKEELEKLDSIPQTTKFESIYEVHYKIKYDNRKISLEDEIKQFLEFSRNIESFDECEHSLKHLKNLLATRKDQLKQLYDGLKQTRGFSEDCKDSCLHQLICMLVKMSCFTSTNVSAEAVRCLGEIGPGDLRTLVLQPDKFLPNVKNTPWELVLGCALPLLSKYVIDCDVDVIEAASRAFFQILGTKEGRKLAESETDLGFGTVNPTYLTPFFYTTVRKINFNINVNGDCFATVVGNPDLWIPEKCDHKTWIIGLVSTILGTFQETDFFSSFIAVCKLKTEFCEQILPLIIYMILSSNVATITNLISAQIESFFAKHWELTVINNNQKSSNITVDRSSVQCMLNVIHFIRLQLNITTKKQIKDLNLDYLKVAKAAHFCSAHFTALLYADLWCQKQVGQFDIFPSSSSTQLDLIYEKLDEVTGNALQTILRKAYKAVGEVDALLGCGSSYLLNPQRRVEHYKELGKWNLVINHYEMEVLHGGKNSQQSLVQSLSNANFYQLSMICSYAFDEPDYECMWRLAQWNDSKFVKTTTSTVVNRDNYDKYKFDAFKALHDMDDFGFKKSIDNVRSAIVRNLFGINLESSNNFYNILTQMQSFNEIEDFAHGVGSNKLGELLKEWEIQDGLIQNDFQYVEPVKAQRIVLLTEFLKKHDQGDDLKHTMVDFILDYAEYARMEGSAYTSSRILNNLRLLPNLSSDVVARIQFEEAQLCWSLKDVIIAKRILQQLCNDENVNPRLHAKALRMTGEWMMESGSENRQTIMDDYFKKSLEILAKNLKSHQDEKSMIDTFDQMAKFADREYQEVNTHIKSDIFQKKKDNMVKAMQTVAEFRRKYPVVQKAPKDLQKAMGTKDKQCKIDKCEIDNIEAEKNNFLKQALKYYLRILMNSDYHDITIFRLISLLLENRNNDLISKVLQTDLIKIPTHKFISILPQIIPHIASATNDLFCQTINKVVEKCANEHPYHTLPLLLALALSNQDQIYSNSKVSVNDAKMQRAKVLVSKLKKQQSLNGLITKMEHLSDALMELAYCSSSRGEDASVKVPKKSKIHSIKGYDDVLLPTYTLPVDKSAEYRNIVGIASFGDTYTNVGGINAPKRITCRGTDGIVRTQLVKGQDDLKQDAVMQQVFTMINSLLADNKQTKNLLIRTYKIVPLSMRSGILEWVENTMPIGEYLTGRKGDGGAHGKYRPHDRSSIRCRNDFRNAGNSLHEKLRVYNDICKKIRPVFHKFFEDSFPQPTLWYEKRRAYIHSVATSSMCGYILGIGDRHVNNILVDKNTAEVVHIDFGIAFEQGLVLPTPETVPFRLTRDVVDGMGVSGVEGVFRRSCEKTVEVLRLHYQTIITILEVLLYDPLYDWTVSSAEANKRQKDEQDDSEVNMSFSGEEDASKDVNVNVTAERALLRLKAKLQGTEHGKPTTVEHQVATLIQQAMDPSNLCRLFNGWQPYL